MKFWTTQFFNPFYEKQPQMNRKFYWEGLEAKSSYLDLICNLANFGVLMASRFWYQELWNFNLMVF